jgi:tryptophan halogenase
MNIVVVGGGTAGWLSALILKKETNHNITVIDNSSIGPIGVGEGTTGLFGDIIRKYLSEEEFVRECGATPKMGINFIDWHKDDFISPLYGTFSCNKNYDYALYYGMKNSNVNLYSKTGLLAENKKISIKKGTTKYSFLTEGINAYHLDTYKTINFMKTKCMKLGVKFIDSSIVSVTKNFINKITSINCQDKTIDCDFVIDCSGFHKKIVSEYNPKFISYKKWLSVDTALTFRLSWDDVIYKNPVTISRALSCGWMWMIPIQQNIGCGIVYDSKFTTDEKMILEVSNILGKKIDIKKKIKFQSGRLKKSLYGNVASIGTCYSFLEPLQATSIHTTIIQVKKIVDFLNKKISTRQYNNYCADIVDNYADFVSLHYQFKYIDNEFWQSRIPRKYTQKIIEKCKNKAISEKDYNVKNIDCASHSLWSFTLAGGDLLKYNNQSFTEENIRNIKFWENQIKPTLLNYMSFEQFLNMYE